MNPEISIFRYVTEATFDAYLWQTVENKQKFISQIMTSKSPVRSCEDMDETALSYAEIKALCAGDPRIKEKMDLDVDVARLRLMKADHQSQQYRLEDQLLKVFPRQLEQDAQLLEGFAQDRATLAANPEPEAEFGGLTMSIQFDSLANKFRLTLRGAVSHIMEVGSDARGNITRLTNLIQTLPDRMAKVQARLDATKQQVAAAKAELGKPFPQEEELKTKSARLAELDAELNMDQRAVSREKSAEQER